MISGKNPILPEGFKISEVRKAIETLISDLPNEAGCKSSVEVLATEIITFWGLPSAFQTGSFAKKDQIKKLHKLHATAKQLRQIWESLDPEVRTHIRDEANREGQFKAFRRVKLREVGTVSSESEAALLQFLSFGPELLGKLLPIGEEMVKAGKEKRLRYYSEERLVHGCANVWEDRTGERPKSASNARFAGFVRDVFDAFGIDTDHKSVQNRIRVWSEEDGI